MKLNSSYIFTPQYHHWKPFMDSDRDGLWHQEQRMPALSSKWNCHLEDHLECVTQQCDGLMQKRRYHYKRLSSAMQAPWVDCFLNNEIYCYPLSKKRCVVTPLIAWQEGIVTSGRQQRNAPSQMDRSYISLALRHRITNMSFKIVSTTAPVPVKQP